MLKNAAIVLLAAAAGALAGCGSDSRADAAPPYLHRVVTVPVAIESGYRVERDYALTPNQAASFEGYEVTFTGSRTEQEPHRESKVADFAITSAGRQLPTQSPRLNYYRTRREPIFTPAVYSTATGDLYLSLIEVEGGRVVVRLISQPYQVWMWWSAPLIFLGTVLAIWPATRKARQPVPMVVDAATGAAK